MKELPDEINKVVVDAKRIVVIQAENPDGDSLGSALALEQILGEMDKRVMLYCPIQIPHYLTHLNGWDRVTMDFPIAFDASIIVDTSAASLLERVFKPGNLKKLTAKPCIVIDHHDTLIDLPLDSLNYLDPTAVATSQMIYELAVAQNWPLDNASASFLAASIMSDSLGLTSVKTTARTLYILAELVDKYGISLAKLDQARRALQKRPPIITTYKGRLLQRIEYHLDGKLAMLTIPLQEIKEYSDLYNPSVLALEELRMTEGVEIAVAFKDYNNRVTAKIRDNNALIADKIAEHFGGGGHPFLAGFKVGERSVDDIKQELISVVHDLLEKYSKNDD